MHKGYSTPLVIAIMAFAVVSFLFLIDTAMNPDGTKKVAKITVNTNTANVNATVNQNTNVAINNNINATTDPTAGWKTYTNTRYTYSILYPPEFSAPKADSEVSAFPETPGTESPELSIRKVTGIDTTARVPNTDPKTTTINDMPVTIQDEVGIIGYKVYYFHQTSGYLLIAVPQDIPLTSTFTTMVMTMRAQNPTAGWKTFVNTQYHWTLKYPADWEIVNDSDDPIMEQVFFPNDFNIANSKYASLEAWKKQMLTYESEVYKVTTSSTTVDGLDALWVDVYRLPNETPFFSNIGVWKNGQVVSFSAKDKEQMPLDVIQTFTFTK